MKRLVDFVIATLLVSFGLFRVTGDESPWLSLMAGFLICGAIVRLIVADKHR